MSQANSTGSNLYVKGQLGHCNENLPVILMEVATATSPFSLTSGYSVLSLSLTLAILSSVNFSSLLLPQTPSLIQNHIRFPKLIMLFTIPHLSTLPGPICMPFSTLSTWKMFSNLPIYKAKCSLLCEPSPNTHRGRFRDSSVLYCMPHKTYRQILCYLYTSLHLSHKKD